MKDSKSDHKQEKHNAEYWVTRAKTFGEKCVAIQQDPKLSIDQKLSKQEALTKEITQEIQKDLHLKEDEKHRMLQSVKNYIKTWQQIQDDFEQGKNKSHDSSHSHDNSKSHDKSQEKNKAKDSFKKEELASVKSSDKNKK